MKIGQLVSVHGDLGRIAQIYKDEGKVAVRMRISKDVWIVDEASIEKVDDDRWPA